MKLRVMIETDYSIGPAFNPHGTRLVASNEDEARQGQVSGFGLRPYTLERSMADLLKKDGIKISAGVSPEHLRYEMRKLWENGMSVDDMVPALRKQKLLAPLPAASVKVSPPRPQGF